MENAKALTEPLKNAVTSTVHDAVSAVVTGARFQQAWENANRAAHAAVVKVLTGEGGSAVQTRGDTIQLNIGTVVDTAKQRLTDAGFERAADIPDVDRTVPLFQVDKLDEAQDGMRVLDVIGAWLPVITIVLAALAIWAAPAHRVALMTVGTGVGVMMIALLVALAVMRGVYLDSVPSSGLPGDAAASVFDTFVRFLREAAVTILIVGVISAAAYLYGPGRGARAVRGAAARGTGATGHAMARHGARTGALGRWLDTHRGWTTGVVIAAGALALVLWNHPTPASARSSSASPSWS